MATQWSSPITGTPRLVHFGCFNVFRSIPLLTSAVAVLLALGGTALALELAGYDAPAAMGALWSGSFGSWFSLGSATLVRSVPLILAGLAVAIAFRAGIWNIGAEGQFLAGAAASTTLSLLLAGSPAVIVLPIALIGGTAAGAAWAGIAALLRDRFGVLEVISTIMLNFIALYLVSYLVRGPLQEPLGIYPQSPSIPDAARLPLLAPPSRLHGGIIIAMVAAPALWWFLRFTAAGFRLRAAGANPAAARSSGGILVERVVRRTFLVSGALAGVAGAAEVSGVTYALYENISPGYGYSAIAVALLARLDPLGLVVSGVFFAGLESGALAMQRDAGVPSVVVYLVEAVLILLLLSAPAARRAISRLLPSSRGLVPDEGAA
jgi:simple sugar transport system permease protein